MLRRPRQVPLVVWVLTVFGFLMSLSSSLIVPSYLGFDEPQHVDMVVALASGDGWDDPGTRYVGVGVAVSSSFYYGHTLVPRPLDKALTAVPPRGERKSLTEYGGDKESVGGNPNQIVQHPPLYYGIEALGVLAFDAYDWSYDDLIELMRIITALILLPLPLLAWAMCKRLGTSPHVGVAAAALSLCIPGLARLGGVVNNDALMITTGGALVLAAVHVATGDLSRRTALVIGLLSGLTMLTKGFGLTMLPLILLAYVIGARHLAVKVTSTLLPMASAYAVAFVTGGFWWLRNIVQFGAIQPSGFGKVAQARIDGPPRPSSIPVTWGPFLRGVQDRLSRSFWGGVGVTSEPTVSKTVGTIMWVIAALVVLAGIAWGVRRTGHRLTLLLIALPLPLATVPFLQASYSAYVKHNTLPGVQGRYLYLAVAGLAVVAAVALDRLAGPARALLPAGAIALMLLMQAQGAYRLLDNLWLPRQGGSLRSALSHLEVLSPWNRGLTQAVFALTVLVALLLVPLGLRASVAHDPEPEPALAQEG